MHPGQSIPQAPFDSVRFAAYNPYFAEGLRRMAFLDEDPF